MDRGLTFTSRCYAVLVGGRDLQLFKAAADRNVYMGRVCGSGVCAEPEAIEESMVTAIENGCRLVCVHYMTSDLTYVGAAAATAPFWKACARSGF